MRNYFIVNASTNFCKMIMLTEVVAWVCDLKVLIYSLYLMPYNSG